MGQAEQKQEASNLQLKAEALDRRVPYLGNVADNLTH